MVPRGRRSDGCANCRRSKKGCDQKHPTCGRCSRLQQACYGYKDEMEKHPWDCHQTVTESMSPFTVHLSNQDDPDRRLLQLFHKHFCTGEYEILEQFTHHHIVHDLMLACSIIITTKKGDTEDASTRVTILYVRALQALRATLADQQRAKEDVTLVSTIMMGIFERINPLESSLPSDWSVHFEVLAHIVCARGLAQIQTTHGRAIFRLARRIILDDAIRKQKSAPPFIISCTQGLNADPIYSIVDKLAILISRLSILWEHVNEGTLPVDEIIAASRILRSDFESFGCQEILYAIQGPHPVDGIDNRNISCAFDLPDTTTHALDFRLLLLEWRVYLGLAMDLEDAISCTSAQAQRSSSKDARSANSGLRQRMASTTSLRAMCLLDSVTQTNLPKGWIISVLRLVAPLYFAGSWLQRELYTPGQDTRKDTTAPIHGLGCFPVDKASVQLDHIVETLAHIADRLCDRYAKEAVDMLTVAGP